MGKNVLIVDDSATMRKSIVRSIRQAGIAQAAFEEAGDGAAGMKALETTAFDLILADLDVAEAMTRGAKGCLKQPFTPERIREVLGPFLQ